ncbi:hypothetical protein Hanom_Chr01g00021161 [Helianthus anomalus]
MIGSCNRYVNERLLTVKLIDYVIFYVCCVIKLLVVRVRVTVRVSDGGGGGGGGG